MSKKNPSVVSIYDAKQAPAAASYLNDIQDRPPVTMDKQGSLNLRLRFTLKDLLSEKRLLSAPLVELAIDRSQLEALVPNGNTRSRGYAIEIRGTGHSNNSPVTLLAGLPDITRASFMATKELSEEGQMPDSILAKLESSDPLLSMLCSPTEDFPADSNIARALQHAKAKYGMHLYSKTEDGGMMSQNPKALLIIDETIGATQDSIKNTYFKDAGSRGIHTPGTSLISSIIRTYPPSVARLVWNDQGGRVPFEVTSDTMFFIPKDLADHVIAYIARRKKIVEGLRVCLEETKFAVCASPMHGDWHYDEERNEYENRDTGKVYAADTLYEFCVQLTISMRYHLPRRDACAVVGDHQFYPMPVWPKSGIVNGMPKNEDVKPYPGTLHESVKERLQVVSDKISSDRREAMLKRLNREDVSTSTKESASSGAASSVADDD